jgi:tetratricopeptide (TPR) repeat protein
MTSAKSETSAAMQSAIELLRARKTVEAEEVMQEAVRATEMEFGPLHPATASVYNELGTVLLNVDNFKDAVGAYRRACEGPIPNEQTARKDRLTYLMNLGMALQYANQLDEPEEVLRKGCEARKDHYGAEHPGYAFGLEPLAALLLRRGKAKEALEVLEETVANFWQNGHVRVATALALRGEALKLAGRKDAPFAGCEQLPDHVVLGIADHVAERIPESEPAVVSSVVQDLLPVLKKRFGPDHSRVISTLINIANLESTRGKQGDFAVRIQASREVLDAYDRQRKPKEAVQTLQGIALALSQAGRPDEAVETYGQAAERAQQLKDPALTSQIQRNFGLLLSELKRDDEAEARFCGAVQDAKGSADLEMLSRSQIALGIFYQHRQRLSEAQPLLETALKNITPAHPDAVIARSHLQAVKSGQACGCGNQGEAMAAAFREFVLSRLPQDLLERFDVRLENNDFKVQVHLKRKPEQQELEHLDRIVKHALAEFRRKLRQQS